MDLELVNNVVHYKIWVRCAACGKVVEQNAIPNIEGCTYEDIKEGDIRVKLLQELLDSGWKSGKSSKYIVCTSCANKKVNSYSMSDEEFAIVVIDSCIEEDGKNDEEILNAVKSIGLKLEDEKIIELINAARADKPSKEVLEWEEKVPEEIKSDQ